MALSDRLTLAQARTLRCPVVYALEDSRGVFYVGKTRDPKQRFYQHSRFKNENLYLAKRMREAGDSVRVLVVETKPENLAAAELDAIRVHGANLLNFHSNPARLPSHGGGLVDAKCPQCGGEIDMARQKFCSSCTGKLLARPSKAAMRAEADQALEAFRQSTR